MKNDKDPKWYLADTINAGRKSILLLDTYGTELQPRLKKDEIPQHQANVEELVTRSTGQKQTLVAQKSSTQGQGTVIKKLKRVVVNIRNIVRNNNASKEISIAYGVGERIILTVSSVTAASNIVLDAYQKYTAWSKDAGIIDADLAEITALKESLSTMGKVQDDSMFVRKSKTMDKNTLQRAVEDEVSRLSALGVCQFSENPSIVSLFEDLIPPCHNIKKKTTKESETSPARADL